MFIRSLKCSALALSGLCLSPAVNAQLALQGQFAAAEFDHSKLNSDTDSSLDNETLKGRPYLEYNLGVSYRMKNGIEVLISSGYSHSSLSIQSKRQHPVFAGGQGSQKEDNDYLNVQLSLGKAYRINNRFYGLAQAGVWYNSLYNRTQVVQRESYDINGQFIGTYQQNRHYPRVSTWGLFVSPGLFYNLSKKLSLGLQLRIGYYWDKTKGTDLTTADTYDANGQLVHGKYQSQEIHINETHLRNAPFFSLKYKFRRTE